MSKNISRDLLKIPTISTSSGSFVGDSGGGKITLCTSTPHFSYPLCILYTWCPNHKINKFALISGYRTKSSF